MELPASEVEHSRCAYKHDEGNSSSPLAENLRHRKQEARSSNDQRANLDPKHERHQAGRASIESWSCKMDQNGEPPQHPQPSPGLAVSQIDPGKERHQNGGNAKDNECFKPRRHKQTCNFYPR